MNRRKFLVSIVQPPSDIPPPPPPPLLKLNKPAVEQDFEPFLPRKPIPQPSTSMKPFNWERIPRDSLKGTVWDDINEDTIYKQIDLELLEERFASKQTTSVSYYDYIHSVSFGMNKIAIRRNITEVFIPSI